MHAYTLSLNETPKRPAYWFSDLKLELTALVASAEKSPKRAWILTFEENNILKKNHMKINIKYE